MSTYPENTIFRRFSELKVLNLLRTQAEIHDMEQQLGDIRLEDYESGDLTRMTYAQDFRSIRDNKVEGDSEQYDQLVELGKKLKAYSRSRLNCLTVPA